MPELDSSRIAKETGDVSFTLSGYTGAAGIAIPTATTSTPTVTDPTLTNPVLYAVEGRNLGTGVGIFAQSTAGGDTVLDFKTLVGGPGIILDSDGETITVKVTSMVRPGDVSFLLLEEAPNAIQSMGLLYGTSDGKLLFSASPDGSDEVLVYNGTGFAWQAYQRGTVRSVALSGSGGVQVTGGPITDSGTMGVALSDTGVSAGTYTAPVLQIDAKGRIIAATSSVLGEINTASSLGTGTALFAQKVASDLRFKSIAASGLLSLSDDGYTISLGVNAVTGVAATGSNGVAVTGSPITSSGTLGISLTNTGVNAGTYSNPTLTVDAQGRITNILSVNEAPALSINAGTGVVVTGTNSGSNPAYTVGLGNSGVTAGSYLAPTLVIDSFGRITSAQSNTLGEINLGQNLGSGTTLYVGKSGTLLQFKSLTGSSTLSIVDNGTSIAFDTTGLGTVSSVAAVGSGGINVTGSPITGSGVLQLSLANSGVTAGTYTAASITVDATGRVTSASSNSIGETNTAQNLGNGYPLFVQKNGTTLQFRSILAGAGIDIAPTGTDLTITSAFNVADDMGTIVPTPHTIQFTGATVTNSSGNAHVTVQPVLDDTGVVAGTYASPTLVIDAKGRITSATNTAVVTSIDAKGTNGVQITGGPITSFGTLNVSLTNTGVAAGTYSAATITVDAQGRISAAASNPTNAEANTASNLGAGVGVYAKKVGVDLEFKSLIAGPGITITPTTTDLTITAAPSYTFTGDVVGSGSGTVTLNLSPSGVSAGTYKNATLAIDSKGRVTAATSFAAVSLTGSRSSGAALQNLITILASLGIVIDNTTA